jgi:hypothetical protein
VLGGCPDRGTVVSLGGFFWSLEFGECFKKRFFEGLDWMCGIGISKVGGFACVLDGW